VKIKLLAAGVLTTIAAHANAQSAVSVYGIVDTGVAYVTNIGASHSNVTLMPTTTGTLPSRFGFRGTEDLGDGMKALFVLESGIAPDTGALNQSGRLFGRQGYVGIGGSWGTLTFGRQYTLTYLSMIGDTMGPNIFSGGLLDVYVANARVDNAIGYSGTFGNVTGGVTYSLGRDSVAPAVAGGCAGESGTDSRACRDVSAGLKYDNKQWGAALSYEKMWGGAGAGSPLPSSSQTDTRTMLNVYSMLGATKVGGVYLRRNNEGSLTPKSNLWYIGVTHPINAFVLDGNFGRITFNNSANAASIVALRASYLLSKRTSAYVTAGHVSNSGAANYTVNGGVVAGTAPVAGGSQNGFMVGLRHTF
jgi:predicted porin